MTAHRVTLNGRDWSQGTRPPQSDADRYRAHGPLQGADEAPRIPDAWRGQFWPMLGLAMLSMAVVFTAGLAVLAVGGVG